MLPMCAASISQSLWQAQFCFVMEHQYISFSKRCFALLLLTMAVIFYGIQDGSDGGTSGWPSSCSNGHHPPGRQLPRGMNDRNMKIKDGRPVLEKKGAKSGWGQRESVVKPSIAVQGWYAVVMLWNFSKHTIQYNTIHNSLIIQKIV